MFPASLRQLLVLSAFASGVVVFGACAEDSPADAGGPGAPDGGTASTKDGDASDDDGGERNPDAGDDGGDAIDSGAEEAGTCGPIVTTPGETCVGFGADPETCDPSCEQPYGYVCFDGAPPGFEGCRKVTEASTSSLAESAGHPQTSACPPPGGGR